MSTKICKKCGIEKPIERYGSWVRKDRGTVAVKATCKDCAAEYGRSRKQANVANSKAYRERKRAKIQAQKTPCIVCGFDKHPEAIDFHHINQSNKSFAVAEMMGKSWNLIQAEIDKCVCLCANCHRLHHAGIIPLEDHLP